ncbi:MAG TPA: glycosyltransferase family 4 protein [Xenococcaceae cyanobacterium]
MQKPVLTIFYQFDPWNSSIGGIQTVIRYFLKYAPEDFTVRLVGTGQPGTNIGTWETQEYEGNRIEFLPLIALEADNIRHLIPTTLRYTAALLRHNFSADFLHFYRLEYALASFGWSGEKTFSLQNDIRKQMDAASCKNAILWQKFPQGYFALESLLIRQFDKIYSCHTDSVAFYQQHYPRLRDRFSHLKNTVDLELFFPLTPTAREAERQKLAQELGLAAATRFVLFVGRLHPQKDPLLLLQAFAAMNQPNIHLLIAGAGELELTIETEIARSGIGDRVTRLGAVAPDRVGDLYRLSSVFVVSSAYEGVPIVVLEALACGTPVVGTECGEIPRILSKNSGIVCQDRQPTTMAQALTKILTQPEQYPISACVRAAQPYSAQTVVTEVYQTMRKTWQRRNFVHETAKYIKL